MKRRWLWRFLFAAALALTMGLALSVARACNVKVLWQADLAATEPAPSPAAAAATTGVALFQFNIENAAGPPSATVIIDLKNAKGVTAIDLRANDGDKPGPVLFSLYTPKRGKLGNHLEVKLTEASLKPQDSPAVKTFAEALNVVLEGNAFVTVSLRDKAAGELRGRIGMRKVPVYSAEESATGHNVQLHQQAQLQGRKAKKAAAPKAN